MEHQTKAQIFAIERHGSQPHGCLTIKDHIEDVANNVCIHYDQNINYLPVDMVIEAAFLHDVVEDTDVTVDELEELFGLNIGALVSRVTDKSGKNRLERHLNTYHIIRRDPDAILIKLCDRRHNHERSLKNSETYMEMYKSEYLYFKFALYSPGMFTQLWAELDSQYEQMKELLP